MTKLLLKRQVIELRKQGKSYSEIKQIINVSKSSLSLWLRNITLSQKQLTGLKLKKIRAVERYRETMRLKRIIRNRKYYLDQRNKWLPLTKREGFVAGLFLYWGEGNKVSTNTVSICNTDPAVLKFTVYWIVSCLEVPKQKIRIQLHLYDDMNVNEETNFWSEELGIDRLQFRQPYVKKSLRTSIDQKGFGHGTCSVMIFKTVLKENVLMAIKAISDNYSVA